jgi:hypothetical protein
MIKFLNWVAGLRPRKKPVCGGGEITAEEWRSAATLIARRGSNPPALGSKPEPPAGPPSPEFRSAMKSHKQAVADLRRLQQSKPPFLPDESLQRQILVISQDMQARAEAEKVNAAQLRQIAESLAGFVAAEQGSFPATTDSGQILVAPPKPQPTGGRLIRGDVDMGFVPPRTGSASLLEMVREALGGPQDEEPKAAVLAVVRWLRAGHWDGHGIAEQLEQEANK